MTPVASGGRASLHGNAVGMVLCALLCFCSPVTLAFEFNSSSLSSLTQQHFGARAQYRFDQWVQMLQSARRLPVSEQLRVVNQFWNTQLEDLEDRDLWQREDYWATPLESLGKGAGDCEDFVIGKYFSLIWLGVPANKLRLIYVNARVTNAAGVQTIPHMVLGYYREPDDQPLVLDNLKDTIVSGDDRPDLRPVFSFNADGIYMQGVAPASVDRIGRWRSLLARMRAQGFEP